MRNRLAIWRVLVVCVAMLVFGLVGAQDGGKSGTTGSVATAESWAPKSQADFQKLIGETVVKAMAEQEKLKEKTPDPTEIDKRGTKDSLLAKPIEGARLGLVGALLLTGVLIIFILARNLPVKRTASDMVKVVCAPLLIVMAVVSVLVIEQAYLAPLFGLLGTLSGYILGRTSTDLGGSNAPVIDSSSGTVVGKTGPEGVSGPETTFTPPRVTTQIPSAAPAAVPAGGVGLAIDPIGALRVGAVELLTVSASDTSGNTTPVPKNCRLQISPPTGILESAGGFVVKAVGTGRVTVTAISGTSQSAPIDVEVQ